MNWILANWAAVMAALGCVVTAASAIVALTPTQKDDAIMAKVINVVNFLSVINPKPHVPADAPKA